MAPHASNPILTRLVTAGMGSGQQDKAGIALSLLCLVHCSVGVLGATLLPFIGHEEHSHSQLHMWFAAGVVFFSLLAFARGFSRHRKFEVVLGAVCGLGLLFAGLYFEESAFGVGTILTMVGSFLLIATHLRNIAETNCSQSCCSSSH